MKQKVKNVINVIIDLVTWAFSGIRWSKVEKKRQACPAQQRGWCSGVECHRCAGMTEEEAKEAKKKISALRNKQQ